MSLVIKHVFRSSMSDGTNPNELQPSHWNADHDISEFISSGTWSPSAHWVTGGEDPIDVSDSCLVSATYNIIGNIVFLKGQISFGTLPVVSDPSAIFLLRGLPVNANGITYGQTYKLRNGTKTDGLYESYAANTELTFDLQYSEADNSQSVYFSNWYVAI